METGDLSLTTLSVDETLSNEHNSTEKLNLFTLSLKIMASVD